MPVLVGTSGWQYRDWRGVLYPPGVPQRGWLEYYATRYATVENNGTFYRLPSPQTFEDWRRRTPAGFVMAVKASRYLTHVRRLRDPAEPVERLLGAAAGLGDRLGPVLLQLPPDFRADPGALDRCLAEFARVAAARQLRLRVAVELRHESWWTDDVRDLLTRRSATLCWADRLGRSLTPLWRTADWGYLRLHEGAEAGDRAGTALPWPRYGEQALTTWMERLTGTWPADADIFVYFNNDQGGAAVHDADALTSIAQQAGRATLVYDPDRERAWS
jgi:uncharacterized protein YecE (DUF72 family)